MNNFPNFYTWSAGNVTKLVVEARKAKYHVVQQFKFAKPSVQISLDKLTSYLEENIELPADISDLIQINPPLHDEGSYVVIYDKQNVQVVFKDHGDVETIYMKLTSKREQSWYVSDADSEGIEWGEVKAIFRFNKNAREFLGSDGDYHIWGKASSKQESPLNYYIDTMIRLTSTCYFQSVPSMMHTYVTKGYDGENYINIIGQLEDEMGINDQTLTEKERHRILGEVHKTQDGKLTEYMNAQHGSRPRNKSQSSSSSSSSSSSYESYESYESSSPPPIPPKYDDMEKIYDIGTTFLDISIESDLLEEDVLNLLLVACRSWTEEVERKMFDKWIKYLEDKNGEYSYKDRVIKWLKVYMGYLSRDEKESEKDNQQPTTKTEEKYSISSDSSDDEGSVHDDWDDTYEKPIKNALRRPYANTRLEPKKKPRLEPKDIDVESVSTIASVDTVYLNEIDRKMNNTYKKSKKQVIGQKRRREERKELGSSEPTEEDVKQKMEYLEELGFGEPTKEEVDEIMGELEELDLGDILLPILKGQKDGIFKDIEKKDVGEKNTPDPLDVDSQSDSSSEDDNDNGNKTSDIERYSSSSSDSEVDNILKRHSEDIERGKRNAENRFKEPEHAKKKVVKELLKKDEIEEKGTIFTSDTVKKLLTEENIAKLDSAIVAFKEFIKEAHGTPLLTYIGDEFNLSNNARKNLSVAYKKTEGALKSLPSLRDQLVTKYEAGTDEKYKIKFKTSSIAFEVMYKFYAAMIVTFLLINPHLTKDKEWTDHVNKDIMPVLQEKHNAISVAGKIFLRNVFQD